MTVNQKTVDRLVQLIENGNNLLSSKAYNSDGGEVFDQTRLQQWRMSCLSFLQVAFDSPHSYRSEFFNLFNETYNYETAISACLGILAAAKDDYENGYLYETRRLIEAEIFDDLLEQAEHLHQSGYYQAAAVISGSVLEDGLRKACDRAGITLSASPKLDGMNSELARQGVYNKLVQKQITALADIRNNAAHGKWDAFTKDDVTGMLTQVRTIMATHLS